MYLLESWGNERWPKGLLKIKQGAVLTGRQAVRHTSVTSLLCHNAARGGGTLQALYVAHTLISEAKML